jgi:predicted metal-binding membrane protein
MTSAEKTTDSTRRSPGRVRNLSPFEALSHRDRILILICILVIIALSWAYLIHLDGQMSASMEHDKMMRQMGMTMDMPWTVNDISFTLLMWTVMMVGMMGGSAAPVLLLFGAVQRGRGERLVLPAVLTFGLGYILVWVVFSIGAALLQWTLHQAAVLSEAMAASSPNLAAGILIATGAYQLSPWKGTCLKHCRSPLGFLMTNWRDGKTGALRMGLSHGAYCLGCCWALMCVLFVVGVMNLVWVAALSGLVLFEKIGPAGAIVARVAGLVMIGVGIFLIASTGLRFAG